MILQNYKKYLKAKNSSSSKFAEDCDEVAQKQKNKRISPIVH